MAKQPDPPQTEARPRPANQTILTPELIAELCDHLARGHYVLSACAYVGISRKSFYTWESHGKDARALQTEGRKVPAAQQVYLDFLDAVELARDYGEAWLAEMCLRAAQNPKDHGRWQAYMTILERSRPDRWARWSRGKTPENPHQPKQPPLIDPSKLTDDELDQLEGLLAKSQPEQE